VLSTDQKGSIAEMMIAAFAVKLGIDVYKPVNDGTRRDLTFDFAGTLTRIQCKWAGRHGAVLIVRCYRNRRTRAGMLRRVYTPDEVDAFVAYSLELLLAVREVPRPTEHLPATRADAEQPATRNPLGRGV
jgi:hypothetical protein